ncbi:MAG: long-chain fatty acid--CoA ligase [Candidatus Marinimicrobia bacterium]|nr:long-chain fatty acid--CoA ligase [Candidatus Neomarinimicrobiota bacterium]
MNICYFANVANVPNVKNKTTTQLFIDAVERWPANTRWQIPKGNSWIPVTWMEYGNFVYNIACAINSMGYKYPDKIGILANNSIEWIYTALGIMVANTVLVPVYAGNTPVQSTYIINHSDMKVLFADNPEQVNSIPLPELKHSGLEQIVLFSGDPGECIVNIPIRSFTDISLSGENYYHANPGLIQELARQPKFDDIAYMIYTSGTTGDPKGVPLSHRNLAATSSDWLQVNGPLVPDVVVDIHWLPNSHIYGWGAIGLGNIFGFESYLGTPLNVLDLLPKLKPHVFMSVPAYYEKLYLLATNSSSSKPKKIATLKQMTGGRIGFFLSGGAGLNVEVKEFFLAAGMWITEGYGLSECSPTLTMNRRDAYRFDSVGLPFPSVQIKLAHDHEILARGANIFSGYYKDPKATNAAFTNDGWFKTGDIGQWLDGGFLKIIDRKKDIIVTTGGKNIPPRNIELKFDDEHLIEHLLVYGDEKKYLVAIVTLNEMLVADWAKKNIVRYDDWEELAGSESVYQRIQKTINGVNNQLASYESIKYFKIIPDHFSPENGMLTAALKVRRKEVCLRYKNELEALYQ